MILREVRNKKSGESPRYQESAGVDI